jgi:uncharacterized membrane protein (UPF0127 family)
MRFGIGIFLALMIGACAPASNGAAQEDDWFRVDVIADTGTHSFAVEIADDLAEQRRGLMYRRELASDAGMLFLYDEEDELSFWMRNTYVSLDIIFIDRDGRIVNIARDTEPLSERSLVSDGPAVAALEVVAGTSARLGFRVGDEVRHPFFPFEGD